jgi:leucyl/phenylalanyl-tRNA---protein transferase
MFSTMSDASKVALVRLVNYLTGLGFDFIDCQTATGHLKRLGAREIPRKDFLERLEKAVTSGLNGEQDWRKRTDS